MNKQYVSENQLWIQNSKGNRGGLVCLHHSSAGEITTVFNSLHPRIIDTAVFCLGYNLVFGFNCCMNCLNCHVLVTKRMTKNLLKIELFLVWGNDGLAWRSLLLFVMLFNVISSFLGENSVGP